jgi:hypothetical protein
VEQGWSAPPLLRSDFCSTAPPAPPPYRGKHGGAEQTDPFGLLRFDRATSGRLWHLKPIGVTDSGCNPLSAAPTERSADQRTGRHGR